MSVVNFFYHRIIGRLGDEAGSPAGFLLAHSAQKKGPSAMPESGTNKRPSPSGFIMNGPMWSLGFELGFEIRNIIAGPLASAFIPPDLFAAWVPGAYLLGCRPRRGYRARVDSWAMTRPSSGGSPARMDRSDCGAAGERRPPAQEPHSSQFPLDVVPSSFSQAKPGSC